ncbi:MAG: amidophosphoribosyltransferase [Gammaproteobacteria bacterium]|nr:amidophosphoribosyltransferase [Gammaproteobacteria bacterium]
MCGIVGVLAANPVNQSLFDALTIIQHRGQDAAGVMTCDRGRFYLRKDRGLVRDVLRQQHMLRLRGNMGIGHVRYPTAGSESVSESQPFYVNSPYGLSLVHNGNLINADTLAEELHHSDLRHLNTRSDSEVLLNVLAYELQRVATAKLNPAALFNALKEVYQRLKGGFAVVAMIAGYGLIGFRDPHAIRPLVYGKRETSAGTEYMMASETIALDALGFEIVDFVKPGEAIFINLNGELMRHQCAHKVEHSPCLFEYIYLARPDSVFDGIPIYTARQQMGKYLAQKIQQQFPKHDIDVVIPIPDTSRSSALALAEALNVPYSEGFVKNRYIGRTFIMPGQAERRSSVRLKLNAMRQEFQAKNVLLVDDSIVRGTTSKEIVQMARDVGANKVYFASAAPEIRYPNVYGIDMPSADELIAHGHSVEEIAKLIGADWVIYQALKDVYAAVNSAAPQGVATVKRFEDSVFTGDYVTGGIDKKYLSRIAKLRNDNAKCAQRDKASINQLSDLGDPV